MFNSVSAHTVLQHKSLQVDKGATNLTSLSNSSWDTEHSLIQKPQQTEGPHGTIPVCTHKQYNSLTIQLLLLALLLLSVRRMRGCSYRALHMSQRLHNQRPYAVVLPWTSVAPVLCYHLLDLAGVCIVHQPSSAAVL